MEQGVDAVVGRLKARLTTADDDRVRSLTPSGSPHEGPPILEQTPAHMGGRDDGVTGDGPIERGEGPAMLSSHVDPTSSGTFAIEVSGVSQAYRTRAGSWVVAVRDVSYAVRSGEFLAIVGPSGCGKTSLLNMMTGLVKPGKGTVKVQGNEPSGPSRNVGYMFAQDGLFPWRSARKNVEYGLEIRGVGQAERRKKAERYLEMVGLREFSGAHPHELSHGMRQRVALARTLAVEPEILFLDEPFSALDVQTKLQMQELFISIWERHRLTTVLITHDLDEAALLADRVLVMTASPGQIKADVPIPLERPRDLSKLRYSETYRSLAAGLWELVSEEFEVEHAEPGE